MQFETHFPPAPMNELVDCFLYFKGYTPQHSMERVVPDGASYLIFELDNMPRYVIDNEDHEKRTLYTKVWYSGMHTNYIGINAQPDSEMFVFKFRSGGALPFLHQPVAGYNNQVVAAEEIFGEAIFELRDQLLAGTDYEAKRNVGEQWLLDRINAEFQPPEYILATTQAIRQNPGLEFNSVARLIEESGVSTNYFNQQFKKFVGLTPKQLQRIYRFNEILALVQKEDQVEWTQIALGCGYYDQAHFIKEFKTFCGINPSQFIANYKETDLVNFFPLD